MDEHVYYVGPDGILVHNSCTSSASKAFGKSLGKRPAGKYKSGRSKYEAAHIIPTSGFANRSKRVQNSIKRAQDKFDKNIMKKRVPKEIFKLRPIVDSPKFEGFALEDYDEPSVLGRDNLDEDLTPGFDKEVNWPWKPVTLKKKWSKPKVEGRVGSFNDYPCLEFTTPVFSKRACEVLSDYLLPNGELLPLDSEVGEYFVFNVLKVTHALDVKSSQCSFVEDPPTWAFNCEFFEFEKKKLAGLSIFQILQLPGETYVSDDFVERVNESGLNGFNFTKVWPFPKNTDWEKEAAKQELASSKKMAKSGGLPKGNSLILVFEFAKKKPSKAELKQISNYEDELDVQLVVKSLDEKYFGSLEGREKVDGEMRLFLSSPDVDSLELKLEPWLENLNWGRSVTYIKRYGDLHDPDAKEEVWEI